mgnify:CR=1 FL=1
MPQLTPGIYRSPNQPDFVYEVLSGGGAVAYPTRPGIGPGAGFTPFTGSAQNLPINLADFQQQYQPVATSYTGQSKTIAQATAEFQAGAGRLPYQTAGETIPSAPGYFGGPRGGGTGGERINQGAQATAAAEGIVSSTGQPFVRYQVVKNPQGADVTIGYFADGGFEVVANEPRYDLAGFQPAPSGAQTAGGTAGGLNIAGLTPQQYYSQLETLIGSGLGLSKEQAEAKTAREKLVSDLAGRKTSKEIFEAEATRLGLDYKGKITILDQLDALLLKEQQDIRKIPENLKTTLATHGVTQAQLDAAISQQQKPRLEVLRDLLEQRGVAEAQLQRSLNFVESFTNMALKDEALHIEGLKVMVELEEGDVTKLEKRQKDMLTFAIDERKEVLKVAEEAAKNGATQQQIDQIIGQSTAAGALGVAAQLGVVNRPQVNTFSFEDASGRTQRVIELIDPRTGKLISRTTEPLEGAGGFKPGDRFLSESEVSELRKLGYNVRIGSKLSEISGELALGKILHPESPKPVEAERRQAATALASSFKDLVGGWESPGTTGTPPAGTKISDDALQQLLIQLTGVSNKEAEDIVKLLE